MTIPCPCCPGRMMKQDGRAPLGGQRFRCPAGRRARGDTTKAIERSHVPVEDRLRPMRRRQSVATGQRLLEGIELAQAIRGGRCGPASALGGPWTSRRAPARARAAMATFTWLASRLLHAA